MKHKQQSRQVVSGDSNGTGKTQTVVDHWRPGLLGASVALMIATPLISSDPTLAEGHHVVLVTGWLLLLVGWLVAHVQDRQMPGIRLDAVAIAVALFFLWHSASGLLMLSAGHGRLVLNAIWVWLAFGVAFFVFRDLVRTPRVLRALLSVVMASGIGLAAFGVYEYAVSMPRARALFRAHPEQVIESLGIEAPPGSPARRQLADRIESTEPNATFALANSLAAFLVPPTVLVCGVLFSAWLGVIHRWRGWMVLVIGCGLLVSCLLMTKSRAASLAVTVGVIAVVVIASVTRYSRRPWLWVVASCLTLLVAAGALFAALETGVWDRQVLTEASKSMRYRFEFWEATGAMIHAHPWLGCGPGNFQLYYPQYKLPQASETVAEPHNFLLEVAATSGLPGLGLLILVGAVLAWQLYRNTGCEQQQTMIVESSSETSEDRRAVRAIYVGVAAGFGLAYIAGSLVLEIPDLALPWIWGPVVAVFLWVLHPWVTAGRVPVFLLGVSIIALLVSLLASGGIGIPGVGIVIWVLAALLSSDVVLSAERGGRVLGRRGNIGAAVGSLALLGAAYFTLYHPVLAAKREIAEAHSAQSAKEAIRHLQTAADADRWWARPYEFAAQVCQREWITRSSVNWQHAFDQSVRLALRRNRHSYALNQRKGNWLIEVYAAKGGDVLLERAVEAFADAVALYPNSNFLHAQLAWVLYLDGRYQEARTEACRALELNTLVPHRELKLSARHLVGQKLADPTRIPPSATAEQSMQFLRKLKRGD